MKILVIIWSLWWHPLHVSVTEAKYNADSKSLQITSRIFIDDLELSIKAARQLESLDLLEPKSGTTDELMSAYIRDHIRIRLDGKPARINYLGHEVDDPAVIAYLEIEGVKKFKTIEITNNVIQETHTDQSNLVHVTYRDKTKSLRLTSDKPTDILSFEQK